MGLINGTFLDALREIFGPPRFMLKKIDPLTGNYSMKKFVSGHTRPLKLCPLNKDKISLQMDLIAIFYIFLMFTNPLAFSDEIAMYKLFFSKLSKLIFSLGSIVHFCGEASH